MAASRPFHAGLAPLSCTSVPGQLARFELDDRRRVDIYVPHAVACGAEACETVGFRIEVLRPGREVAAVLTEGDLVGVFGAQFAVQAIDAFLAGDLAGARRLVVCAGGAWSGLGRLLADVSSVRRRT